ncbi:Aldolase-type TIM barrel domain and Glycoside hydrolase, superfamily domain and Hyaluronidase family-containing protein [Strongyloides ratti]|uniref:Hyaluronidase n=1 Tax=Strongyloides ratti TaxID=34506 RepID=A0A090LDU4_STRRB|nr:Aldolase-type TIM barrel domain and Glycoside hydrolase, superfamily domain and Hyaluronidase family-containing protein [Strongyloides ratti]CEF66298.1 Aldolase-type TIM barrel domain and Glycoside hydrolase, superfamily domain and Hyaluronidase family-containing protein [Strongyloides ratti]
MLCTKTIFGDEIPSFYWNSFTENCKKINLTIPVEKYGIITNKDQKFQGENIVIFYEKNVGLYPYLKYINATHNEFINGGIPQNANISAHVKKLRNDINIIIPDPEFSGIAVIDVEEWRPTYDSNWSKKRIYRYESVQRVLTRFPYLNWNQASKIARKEFDEAAYNFLMVTLKECQIWRPLAKWGFYGFPICDESGLQRNSTFCYPTHNNELIPLLKHTDALYPTAYLYPGRPVETARLYVKDVLRETKRLNNLIIKEGYKKKEIYVYHKFELDPYNDVIEDIQFYDKATLDATYKQAIDFNINNIILWTTSKNIMKRCGYIKNYIETSLGPYIKKIIKSYIL